LAVVFLWLCHCASAILPRSNSTVVSLASCTVIFRLWCVGVVGEHGGGVVDG
jgi:hypothetical protein